MKLTKFQLKKIIKEELNEYSTWQPEYEKLTPEQQKVAKLCDQLTEAIYDMGESSAEMTDTYLILFRALAEAGLSIKYMAQMV